MHDIDPTAAAVFTLIVLGGAAAVYLFVLVRFFAWFYAEWRKERADRERRAVWQRRLAEAQSQQRTSSSASGFGSIDGSGNVRVVGGRQS